MYEQTESRAAVVRRVLLIGVWLVALVALVALVWLLVWILFFRHHHTAAPAKNVDTSLHRKSTSAGSSNTSNPALSGQGTGGGANSNSNPATSGAQTNDTHPQTGGQTELANAGAGNVVLPVMVATIAGSSLYYVRLRKKLGA